MVKLLTVLSLLLTLAGCAGGIAAPCDDYDPVGICANSHSHTYDGGGRP